MKKLFIISTLLLTTNLFTGCGGGGSGASKEGKAVGYLVDSPIVGLEYICESKSYFTDNKGKFSCDTFPITFKIGNYTIASISGITSDSIIYPQDLIGLSRDNKTDISMIELLQFFQALDDDKDISSSINITRDKRDSFSDVHGNREDPNNPMSPLTALEIAGIAPEDPGRANNHLLKSQNPNNFISADTQDKSPYAGKWAGTGWNWELRFKHNSGDFVSNLFGIDKSKITFDKEKTIMSLTVAQENAFVFDVDKNGEISGNGVIVYNLYPNLCGVHALTTQVNASVNMMSKMTDFFKLSSTIYKKTIEDFLIQNSNLDKDTYGWMTDLYNSRKSLDAVIGVFKKKVDKKIKDQAVKIIDGVKKSSNVCIVAASSAATGGQSIGPLSVHDIWSHSQLDIAKSLITGSAINVANLVLSIPGVTQVQYYYKGLQNGPERRTFNLSGHIDDNGKMFLEMDSIDGSSDLVLEYTVNFKTETPTFPMWSPFLKEGGTIYPANHEVLTYNYITEMVDKTYVDKADGNKTKKIQVPINKMVVETNSYPAPMVTFQGSGTQRNNVSVWHEYTYSWKAYKVSD